MKYRKKPIVIEAFQMTKERRENNFDWPNWLHVAWQKDHDMVGAIFPSEYPASDGTDNLVIYTLEGVMLVDWNDWIIRGVNGELYPCKPDIFEATYDPMEASGDRVSGLLEACHGRSVEEVERALRCLDWAENMCLEWEEPTGEESPDE